LFRAVIIIGYCIIGAVVAQLYIPADPFNLLYVEKNMFLSDKNPRTLMIRPLFNIAKTNNQWSLKVRSEFYYNSSAPNLENMSDRWIGKGAGHFSSINMSYLNKYFALSAEPYYFIDQNDEYEEPQRLPKFSRLNDNRPHLNSPYIAYGIRELQLYAKYKGIGAGFSNANMWWGAGIHSSIMMTNNTSGFGHAFLGTVNEKMYKNIGINARYIFSKLDKKNLYQPYYSAFAISLSYYSDEIYTIGVTKTVLTGGTYYSDENIDWKSAALAVFWSGVVPQQDQKEYHETWSHDDHVAAGYFTIDIKKSSLKLFFEIAKNDIIWDPEVFLMYPDHSIATNIGMRKYNIFGHEQLFFGIEYISIRLPRLSPHIYSPGDFYDRHGFDYQSYNGRRWVAHSGSDSDDLFIMVGWLDEAITILPSFNYERHGLRLPTSYPETNLITDQLYNIWPETKLEFRLDLRYKYKDYKINFYYEREISLNLESKDKTRKGSVIWIGIERDITKSIFDIVKKTRYFK
jgi:hypothetical protein